MKLRHALLAGYCLLCTACLIWPGYALIGNRLEPYVLGLLPGRTASESAVGYVASDRSLGLLVMYSITGATIIVVLSVRR